jgi:hypothetical protein
MAFGLATTLAVPHRDSTRPGESHPLATKELHPSTSHMQRTPPAPKATSLV